MADIKELLDAYEQRAINGPVSDWDPRGGDEPHHRVIERTIRFEKQLRADNVSLVAALRAVLDDADKADAAAHQVMEYGVPAGKVSTINLRRAITDALVKSDG